MKPASVILIAILFLAIGILISNWYIRTKYTCYDLPKHGSPDIWGKRYWFALADVAHRVPCSLCRPEAESLISFIHDATNFKLSKPIYNENNFSMWLNKFSEIKAKRDAVQ